MKGKKHTPEQIIAKLREADAELNGGATIGQVCQKLGISEPTCHRSRAQNARTLNPLLRCAATNPRHRASRAMSRLPLAIACLLVCDGSILRESDYELKMWLIERTQTFWALCLTDFQDAPAMVRDHIYAGRVLPGRDQPLET